jgi:uncharacterized membrane protein YwzB
VLPGLPDSASVSYIVYVIFVNLKYWTITSKFEGLNNAGVNKLCASSLYFKYEHNDKRQRKVYMCTQSSNYSPCSIPSLLEYFGVASVSYIVYIIFVNLKYWITTSKFEGLYNAGVF